MSTVSVLSDSGRLSQLRSLNILGKPAESHFDAVVELVATALRVSAAFINFVDDVQTWCHAAWGAARLNRPNEHCLCAAAVETGDVLIISDASRSPSFANHPIVTDERRVRFYAGVVLRLPSGLPLGTLCVTDTQARDIDDREIRILRKFAQQVIKHLEAIEAQREIRSLRDRLEHAQLNRDQFLAMLAHELRAPLAPILTAVQLLQQVEITLDQRIWAKSLIDRHVRYMSEIVDHLLSASLVSFGVVELELGPVSSRKLVDQAIEMSQGFILDGRHAFSCTIVDDPWVLADQTQCPLLISNLLTNAAKYTPEGGNIDVTVEASDDGVEIHVLDSGIGIDAQDINEIFEVFGQSKQPLDRAKGGMGLGLALARRLAEWHGGSLGVKSAGRGQGSEFILTLKPADRPVAPTVEDQANLGSTLDIVIVEDNVDTADALALYYRIYGHSVRVAYRAQDALAMMIEQQPDVVISDIGLPNTDGYELVQKLAKINSMARTAFIAVTGYGSEMDRERAFRAGFDAHFAKPVDLKALDTMLARLTLKKQSAPS
ncbi:hybrid sensor histidine kinase/response regulator [Caballeronia sp. HLA56]